MNIQTIVFNSLWQHFTISSLLVIVLLIAFKLIKVSAEIRSWVWLSSILAMVLVPLFLIGLNVIQKDTSLLLEDEVLIENNENEYKQKEDEIRLDNQSLVAYFNQSFNSNKPMQSGYYINKQATPKWQMGIAKFILSLLPYLLMFMAFVSLLKVIKLFVQVAIEYRIKSRATEHIKDNVYFSSDVFVPALVGFFKTKILLPKSVQTLSKENQDFIIAHENAHSKRKDQIWGFLIRFVESIIWFSPLFYLMDKQLKHTREIACDQRAILQINQQKEVNVHTENNYAQMLVDCVALFLLDKKQVSHTNLISNKGFFRKRVDEVVSSKLHSQTRNISLSVFCAIGLLLSTGLFANNALNDNQVIRNIDEIVDDVNIKQSIFAIDEFMQTFRSEDVEIEYVYYDPKSQEYSIQFQEKLEDGFFHGENDLKSVKAIEQFSYQHDLKRPSITSWTSTEETSIFEEIEHGDWVSGFTIKFYLKKNAIDVYLLRTMDAFEENMDKIYSGDTLLNAYEKSNNGLFSFLSVDTAIDEGCSKRHQYGFDHSLDYIRDIIVHRMSDSDDIKQICKQINTIHTTNYILFHNAKMNKSKILKDYAKVALIQDLDERYKQAKVFHDQYEDYVNYIPVTEGKVPEHNLTKLEMDSHKVLWKINTIYQEGVLASGRSMDFGIQTKIGIAQNKEVFDMYMEKFRQIIRYDFDIDMMVRDDNKIIFGIVLDLFLIKDFLSEMSDAEIKALRDIEFDGHYTDNFDTPLTENQILHFQEMKNLKSMEFEKLESELAIRAGEGIKIIVIKHTDNFFNFRVESISEALHDEFVTMLYESYDSKVVEHGMFYDSTIIGNAFTLIR